MIKIIAEKILPLGGNSEVQQTETKILTVETNSIYDAQVNADKLEVRELTEEVRTAHEHIHADKAAVEQSEANALLYAQAADEAATDSETSASTSHQFAQEATASKNAAKTSETNAKASETKALASQNAAKTSETNAKASETASAASKTSALNSATSASNSAQTATEKAAIATTKASDASLSASNALASQNAAKASETNAAASKNAAKTSETNAKASEIAADDSKDVAIEKASTATEQATIATTKASESLASANKAKTSETNAKTSETNASNSKNAAANSATASANSANAAELSEENAAASEAAALASKNAAKTSETNANASKNSAASSASTATTKANEASASASNALASKNAAKTSETNAKASELKAAEYAATVAGGLLDGGNVDLSSGEYPATPAHGTFWKVTTGGTVNSVDYGVGDTLVYSKVSGFYKIDNTESVTSVNGLKGSVTLNSGHVGAVAKTGDTMTGDLVFAKGSGKGSVLPSHYYHDTYSDDFREVYVHAYPNGETESYNSKFNWRVRNGNSYRVLVYDGIDLTLNGYKTYHEGHKPTWNDVGGNSYWANTGSGFMKAHDKWVQAATGSYGFLPFANGQSFVGNSAWQFKEIWGNSLRGGSVDVTDGITAGAGIEGTAILGKPSPDKSGIHLGGSTGYSEVTPVTASGDYLWSKGLRYLENVGDWFIGGNFRLYHEDHKPTASEIRALDTTGGTMTGDLKLTDETKIVSSSNPGTAIRFNSSGDVIASADTATMYFRPNGTTNSTGQMTLPSDGILRVNSILLQSAQRDDANAATRKDYVDSGLAEKFDKSGGQIGWVHLNIDGDNRDMLKFGSARPWSFQMKGAHAEQGIALVSHVPDKTFHVGHKDGSNSLTIAVSNSDAHKNVQMFRPRAMSEQENTANALTRKDYVDAEDNKRVAKSGDTMSGDLNLRNLNASSHIKASSNVTAGKDKAWQGTLVSSSTTNEMAVGLSTDKGNSITDYVRIGRNKLQYHTGSTTTNIYHEGHKPTLDEVQPLTTIAKTLTVNNNWIDTGIEGAHLASGSYMVQVYVNDSDTGFFSEYFTGTMSWYNGGTNDTSTNEIFLHSAGHHNRKGQSLHLRTARQPTSKFLKLQISASTSLPSASYTFKFRRLI
ncbi:hypothetical protein KGV31_002177 [Vibrio parahaemolyticus]|nr:hypothetical protein [Vibrio parahaemolyticus]EHU0344320.1 hypothetical protein [Vibrio parahaemolyticus]EHU0354354.1 hypothetical protein [Vibrio parahaemolyticus]